MASKRVNTATLIRGEIYTLRHPDNSPANPLSSLKFEHGVPTIITDSKVLNILEGLCDEISDGDGEWFEKPTFLVERGVTAPEPRNNRKVTRLSDRPVKNRKRRRAS